MKTTKMLTTILLTILCVNCKGPQVKHQVNFDISFKFNRCAVRCFDFMQIKTTDAHICNLWPKKIPDDFPEYYTIDNYEGKEYLKFIPGNYNISNCDKITGFKLEAYSKNIKPQAKRLKEYYEDRQ